jgi:plasmid stabilization system protein ParE
LKRRRFRLEVATSFASDLARYEELVAEHAPPERVASIAAEIQSACQRLVAAPIRGTDWGTVRPGLRSVPALGRGTIVFLIDESRSRVVVLGWLWRGARIDAAVAGYRETPSKP